MRIFLNALLLIGLGASLAPAADPLQAVYARLDKAAPGFRGFTANVRRVSHLEGLDEETVETGKIAVRRPKPHDLQMRADMDPPNPQQVVLDGSKIEIYYPKSNTIQPVEVGKSSRGMLEQFLLLGWGTTSRDLQGSYDITYGGTETVAGEKTDRLELVPKDKDLLAHVRKIEIWISDSTGIAVQQKIYQRGEYNLATYSNLKLRSDIPESSVKLTAPKNAQREKTLR